MTFHLDLTLCARCCVHLGYWRPPERLCPACAAAAKSATTEEADQ